MRRARFCNTWQHWPTNPPRHEAGLRLAMGERLTLGQRHHDHERGLFDPGPGSQRANVFAQSIALLNRERSTTGRRQKKEKPCLPACGDRTQSECCIACSCGSRSPVRVDCYPYNQGTPAQGTHVALPSMQPYNRNIAAIYSLEPSGVPLENSTLQP